MVGFQIGENLNGLLTTDIASLEISFKVVIPFKVV